MSSQPDQARVPGGAPGQAGRRDLVKQLIKDLEFFVDDSGYNPQQLQALRVFLRAPLDMQPCIDIVPADEYDERVERIERIIDDQKALRHSTEPDWEPTILQFCLLLLMPLEALRNPAHPVYMEESLNGVEGMVKHFFQKQTKVDGEDDAACDPDSASKGKGPAKWEKVYRNQTEKRKCLTADNNRCIITRLLHPHVCHIVPFTWNNNTDNMARARMSNRVIPALIFGSSLDGPPASVFDMLAKCGGTDLSSNMVAMGPTMHFWWEKKVFGLKFMGSTPKNNGESEIQLQLRYMVWNPTNESKNRTSISDQKEGPNRLLDRLNHSFSEPACPLQCEDCRHIAGVVAHDGYTHCPSFSGTIVRVTRKTVDVPFFKAMMDIQWAIVCAAAMSGAAEAPELLDDFPDGFGDPFVVASPIQSSQASSIHGNIASRTPQSEKPTELDLDAPNLLDNVSVDGDSFSGISFGSDEEAN